PVLDKYEVFGGVTGDRTDVEQSLYQYIKENCDIRSGFDPYGVTLKGVSLEEIKMLTDNNGEYFYDEITGYMRYGQFDNSIMDFVPQMEESAKTKNMEEVTEELTKRQKEAGKIDGKILKLLMYVEGVKTTSTGVARFFGKLSGTDNFVKRICSNGKAKSNVGVEEDLVYQAVSGKYYSVTEKLEDLKGELDWIIYVYNYPLTRGYFFDGGFRSGAYDILSVIQKTQEKIDQSLSLIEEIRQDTRTLMGNLSASRGVLDKNRASLSDSVNTAFSQEFDELEKYETGEANSLCDLDTLNRQLLDCRNVLTEMEGAVSGLAGCYMDIDSIGGVYGMIDDCIAVCSQYPAGSIQFNYGGLSLGEGMSLDALEKIKNVLTNNQLKLVIDDVGSISTNSSSYKDLSSMHCGFSMSDNSPDTDPQKLYEDFLYNKYIDIHFSNYRSPNKEGLLQYETEYVLGKKAGDKENLKEVISQLILLRFTMDFSYIICDTEKKNECLAMATALLGFTGVYGIIRLGEYLLLAAWAYGEAVNDVKILMDGGTVSLVKTSREWKTKLEDIVSKTITGDSGGNENGLDYGEYLQLLLFLENKEKKIFRTMDIMELNMIAKGYPHIRMYRYLYGIKGNVLFAYYHGKYQYTQSIEFHY
ncbi:MAG: DUF5702 domain-containing protein, partial [Alistipes sp.]|nr:DUF5702 domain-containing protein [Alistipes sp.]